VDEISGKCSVERGAALLPCAGLVPEHRLGDLIERLARIDVDPRNHIVPGDCQGHVDELGRTVRRVGDVAGVHHAVVVVVRPGHLARSVELVIEQQHRQVIVGATIGLAPVCEQAQQLTGYRCP
jgi:hypothetical protein